MLISYSTEGYHLKAVIIAAGEGNRLKPLTLARSKHMIPIAGKPILEYLFIALKEADITEIFVIVGHYKALIQNYFKNGDKWGLKIVYLHQEKMLGTANAISVVEEFIGKEEFLVAYGDLLIDHSVIQSAIEKHNDKGYNVLTVVSVPTPQRYGVVTLENDKIKGILEKPKSGIANGNLINAGIYVFSKEIFEEIKKTPKSVRGEYEITDTIQRLLNRNIPIVPNIINSESWMDIGYPWDLLEANKKKLEDEKSLIKGKIEDGAHINGIIVLEKDTKIRSGAYIEGPVYIGEGSDIGPNCYIRQFTSIGRNVRIGNACEIKNSLILDGTHIGHLSYVGDSIIGENCNFGAGTITANLRFDKKTIKVKVNEELVDSGRNKFGTIMGDNVQVGVGTKFMPGVKIGSNSWIAPNVVVYRNVLSKSFVYQKNELEHLILRE